MTARITLQLDPTTDTTGNAEQVARMIGVSAWHISGDYLVVENPLLDYRVTDNETYSGKLDRIPNGAVVSLIQEEPNTIEQKIEQEIQSKNLNAPRLTPDHIDSVIVDQYYFTAANAQWGADPNTTALIGMHKQLETLTFCVLILKNGFTVTGESACASPENFDAEIGRKIAFENARNKIWQLEGYLLKQQLHEVAKNLPMKSDGALEFMKKFADGHRIVSTGDLTELQISEAHSDGRIYIEPKGGLGWVALPWELTTSKEKQRGIDKFLGTRIPILDQIYDVCQAIEKCGASPELTEAVTKAGQLREPITELVNQAVALGIGDGIVAVSYSNKTKVDVDLSALPDLKVADNLPVNEPCNCSSCGSASNGRDERLNNRENTYMLIQVISTKNISNDLRNKAEKKLSELIDKIN